MQERAALRRLALAVAGFLAFVTPVPSPVRGQQAQAAADLDPEPSGIVWGALVRATDKVPGDRGKLLDEGLVERLQQTFSFRHFQLLGEHTQPLSREYETWVLPSPELYMKVDSKGPLEGGLGLHLQLWRQDNVILKTDVILNLGSPIFIAGPKWGNDQLLFVIELREQAQCGKAETSKAEP